MATAAITPALFSNPATAVIGAGLLGFQVIGGIFQHHSQAVKNEAAALNSAVPEVEQSIANTFDALNKGQINPAQAKQVLDAIPNQYSAVVYGQFGVKNKSGNGPDTVLKDWIQPDIQKAENLIASGQAGDLNLDAIPSHAGFAGARSIDIQFSGSPWTVPNAVAPTPRITSPTPTSIAVDSGSATATTNAVSTPAEIPVLTAPLSLNINWGSVLLWGGLILVAIWLFSGKHHR